MKKIQLFIASTIFIASASNAQISKGSVLLGGGISAFKEKSESTNGAGKGNGIFVSPSLGFAVGENKVLGFKVGYGHSEGRNSQTTYEYETNSHNIGLFYRSYLSLGKSFYLFGEAGLGYTKNKYENETFSTFPRAKNSQSISSVSLNLFPGVAYAVNKRFHLEASINNLLNLSYGKEKQENVSGSSNIKSETNRFDFGANVSSTSPITLGFRFVLAK